jgi:hypothetical protein
MGILVSSYFLLIKECRKFNLPQNYKTGYRLNSS